MVAVVVVVERSKWEPTMLLTVAMDVTKFDDEDADADDVRDNA